MWIWEGERTTPSVGSLSTEAHWRRVYRSRSLPTEVVAYSQDGEILVGTTAKRQAGDARCRMGSLASLGLQAALNPLNTFASVKRWFGRDYAEAQTCRCPCTREVGSMHGRAGRCSSCSVGPSRWQRQPQPSRTTSRMRTGRCYRAVERSGPPIS